MLSLSASREYHSVDILEDFFLGIQEAARNTNNKTAEQFLSLPVRTATGNESTK